MNNLSFLTDSTLDRLLSVALSIANRKIASTNWIDPRLLDCNQYFPGIPNAVIEVVREYTRRNGA